MEVHVSHETLLSQMISPYFNRRSDEYGGSCEKRLRLVRECLEAVRDAVGDAMALGIRFNCDELLPGGYDQNEARQVLATICDWGLIDFADLDVAVEPQQLWMGMPSVFLEKHPYKPYVEGAPRSFNEAYWRELKPDLLPRPAAVLLEVLALSGAH